MIHPDVLIVGAGPCGSFLAKVLSEKGLEVVVVEEHPQIGHPSCCAGIVGIRGMRALGIKKEDWVLGELKSVQLFSPSGLSAKIGRGRKEAWVIDRAAFDQRLAEEALNAGAEFYLSTRCVGIDLSTSKVKLSGVFPGFAKPSVIVGADGFSSIVRNSIGLNLKEFTFCTQIETKGEIEEETVEIYLGRQFSPGFFAWGVRAGDVCRIGLGTVSGNPVKNLRNLITEHPRIASRIKSGITIGAGVKAIPRTFIASPARGNILLIGDAAGQVKPITGGGIFVGLFCANIAALSILRAFEERKPEKASRFYVQMFRKELLGELQISKFASRFLFNLSDREMDALMSLFEDRRFTKIIKNAFDFDFHSSLIKALTPFFPEIIGKLAVHRLTGPASNIISRPSNS